MFGHIERKPNHTNIASARSNESAKIEDFRLVSLDEFLGA